MTSRRPASYIEYDLTEARMARVWAHVDRRSRGGVRSRQRSRVVTWGSLAVVAGVLLGWAVSGPLSTDTGRELHLSAAPPILDRSSAPRQGSLLHASEQSMAVDLGDGSNIRLAPRSKLAMQALKPSETRLALSEGEVTCDVVKDPDRNFFVNAGPVSVRVIGTKFTVHRHLEPKGETIAVAVERGIVEVTGPDGVIKSLSRGESWSVMVSGGDAQQSREQVTAQAPSEFVESKLNRAPGSSTSPRVPDLFSAARSARRAGNSAEAARLYEQFLTSSPTDGRAGIAALELGRLKMDQLGDAKGAIPWLSTAASLGAGGLGDDALARLVLARARLGQTAACRKVRADYLKAYPEGVHVRQVKGLCP